MKLIEKPAKGEFPAYASMYIDLLPDDGAVLTHLSQNFKASETLVKSLSKEKLLYRYDEGKWTIKEVLVHIIDDERIYAYRAMCIARGEKIALPGFDQDEYAFNSGANARELESILEEHEAVRMSTIALFNSFTDADLIKNCVANNNKVSVRALVYHIAGHELHHINLIKAKYL